MGAKRCSNIETHWVRLRYNSNTITIRGSRNNIGVTCPVEALSENCTSKLEGRAVNGVEGIKVAAVCVPAKLSAVFFGGHSKLKSQNGVTSYGASVWPWEEVIELAFGIAVQLHLSRSKS